MMGWRRWVHCLFAATLLAGGGCSWFPLVDYPPPPWKVPDDEPTKVTDLNFSG